MSIKAWTDYPFVELGDIPSENAPVREVEVLNYDRNKYCDIIVEGVKSNIKAGYIYQKSGYFGSVPPLSDEQLDSLPDPR